VLPRSGPRSSSLAGLPREFTLRVQATGRRVQRLSLTQSRMLIGATFHFCRVLRIP